MEKKEESIIIDNMPRYSTITATTKREIVLLKAHPCRYGKCIFCDYILDNSTSEDIIDINKKILSYVTGKFGVLEVIDSASIFDLPIETLNDIKQVIIQKNIHTIYVESHYIYKHKIKWLRDFFNIKVIVKIGIESFDEEFRNNFLKKGIIFKDIKTLKENFDSPCIMVGIKGQTKEMIDNDIKILCENFEYGTINVWCNNSTEVKRDDELVKYFIEKYSYLRNDKRFDVLIENTDFGVGN